MSDTVPETVYVALGCRWTEDGACRVLLVGAFRTEAAASLALDTEGFDRKHRNITHCFRDVVHCIPALSIEVGEEG